MPVPEAEALVGGLRARFDPVGAHGIPAHITLLFPFVEVDALRPEVLAQLEVRFAAVEPFDFTMARTARFLEVVFLDPEPAEPFRDLVRLLSGDWPEHPPHEGRFTDILPHLTVAHSTNAEELDRIDDELRRGLPISCHAHEAWLMAEGAERWSVHTRFPFGRGGAS